jgi:NAD(P)-dependent dehydrogenase (short-subunit alcohol dehydrogenase family)
MERADWDRILDVNLTGTLRGCLIFGAHMLERGSGRIINIASLASFLGLYQVVAYGASKGAVVSLTKALAVEWAPQGVCVNAIAPGVFLTDLNRDFLEGTPRGKELVMRTPMKRFGDVSPTRSIVCLGETACTSCSDVVQVEPRLSAAGDCDCLRPVARRSSPKATRPSWCCSREQHEWRRWSTPGP